MCITGSEDRLGHNSGQVDDGKTEEALEHIRYERRIVVWTWRLMAVSKGWGKRCEKNKFEDTMI